MRGDRLAAARKHAGLTQVELAAALGDRYDRSMISIAEHNRSALLFDGAVKAAETLGISLDYLAGLTDDPAPAARLASDLADARAKASELEDAAALPAKPAGGRVLPFAHAETRLVAFVQDVGLAAGAGANAEDERVLGNLTFRTSWLKRHGLSPEHCRVIEVVGNSMEPTLQHRAIVLVDFLRNVRRHGKIFAVRYVDGPVVKRLRHDKDGWWLDSDNLMYPSMPWLRDAEVLGQVMWTGRTL